MRTEAARPPERATAEALVEERAIGAVVAVRPDGTRATRLRVFCAEREAAIPVETCAVCERCVAISATPAQRGATITCRVTDARRDELARREFGPDVAEAAARTRVGDVMGRRVVAVRRDVPLSFVARLLRDEGVQAITVVSDEGLVVGILSAADLALGAPLEAGHTAETAMTPLVHTVPESARMAHAIGLMATEDVRQVPVLAEDGEVVGLLTDREALQWVALGLGYAPVLNLPRARRAATRDSSDAPHDGAHGLESMRTRLRGDHAQLRDYLAATEDAAARVRIVGWTAMVELARAVRLLTSALRVHLAIEETQLAPLIAASEPRGPEMVQAMRKEHAAQRAALVAVAEDIAAGARPPGDLADEVGWLVESLRADMEHEENALLAANDGADGRAP